ncbi:MAG: hypothetical protein HQM08_25855 [Candidatus Riflebacteria bacterium]|nr:hypothetical protein [Candidatus Riflebacteria bacterium]
MLNYFGERHFLLFMIFVVFLGLNTGQEAFAEKSKDDDAPKKQKHSPKKIGKTSEKPKEKLEDKTADTQADTSGSVVDGNTPATDTSTNSGTDSLTSSNSGQDVDPEAPRQPGTPGTVPKTLPVFEVPGWNVPAKETQPASELISTNQSESRKASGGIYVNCPTSDAKVRVNGILKGSVNETLKISETGICDIEIFAPGYVTHKVTQKIPDSEILSFDVNLQPLNSTSTQPSVTEAKVEKKITKEVAGAWKVEFKGSSKAILRKDSIVEIQQNGSSVTMIADTYLPNRSMVSMKDWALMEKYRWTGVFENNKLKLQAWKGQLQFEATIDESGTLLVGKVNSSANRYHTFVNLRRL